MSTPRKDLAAELVANPVAVSAEALASGLAGDEASARAAAARMQPSYEHAHAVLAAARALTDTCIVQARLLTRSGSAPELDEHQVVAERVAYAATEARAAAELIAFAEAARAAGRGSVFIDRVAWAGVAELAASARDRLMPVIEDLGLDEATVERAYPAEIRALMRRLGHESQVRAIGQAVAEARGRMPVPSDLVDSGLDSGLGSSLAELRASVRQFADNEVAPHAERIHTRDELVPDSLIRTMAELGYFGLSVPEDYGGYEMGNPAMLVTTEELSRASLAAAGSLITRPEILTRALLAGGTEAQKRAWLPRIASGELMVAISVTEPNVGSDVASLTCRAEPAEQDGVRGYALSGAKSWCTFAGRADILALLARTDPDSSKGAKGLSLFIVEKPAFYGHEFSVTQPGGGTLSGKADRTPGYRGMHSFTLSLDRYFVPAANLVGEQAGLGRGFYLQMAGFAAGRLQTGGRACGLAQAALERTAAYVADRGQFGKSLIEFPLTQYNLGRMAVRLAAARALTYAAAQAMDQDERGAATVAAQAKLFACDVAVEVTQAGQILHGGWGYAEEYPISRYVVDALVLPIFEGVKPVLELKVIARSLFA